MGVQEYSYEKHLQYMKEDGYENGIRDFTALISWLKSNNRQNDIFQAIDNPDLLSQLFEEYQDWKRFH